jgi:hypothetical protein
MATVLKDFTVSVYRSGPMFFRAKNKSEAKEFAELEMEKYFGKNRAIEDIHETTAKEKSDYPLIFRKAARTTGLWDLKRSGKMKVRHGEYVNPGAAYHKEEAKRWMEMFRQTGDDEYRRKVISEENHVIMSKAKNIPNPIHRSVKRSFPVLGLLVIGGIVWWLVKRNQTV